MMETMWKQLCGQWNCVWCIYLPLWRKLSTPRAVVRRVIYCSLLTLCIFLLTSLFSHNQTFHSAYFSDYDVDMSSDEAHIISNSRFPPYVNELRKRHLHIAQYNDRDMPTNAILLNGDDKMPPILERLAPFYSEDDKQYWNDDVSYHDETISAQMSNKARANNDLAEHNNQLPSPLITVHPIGTQDHDRLDKNTVAEKNAPAKNNLLLSVLMSDNKQKDKKIVPTRNDGELQFKSPPSPNSKQTNLNINSTTNVKVSRRSLQQVHQIQPSLVTGIYWSPYVDRLLPKVSNNSVITFRHSVLSSRRLRLQPAAWNTCGRPRNALVVLDDGSKACARHRAPHNKFLLGEILSYYLGQLLQLDNIPAVVMLQVNTTDLRWTRDDIKHVNWTDGDFLTVSRWITDLERSDVKMPRHLLAAYINRIPMSFHNFSRSQASEDDRDRDLPLIINNLSSIELMNLYQWTDLIIFDYLTGNYDRVASMQDGAEEEHRPEIIQENIRNLCRQPTGKLWLIDNESGLLDGYDLLYTSTAAHRFINYHERMLQSTCIFNQNTVDRLRSLASQRNPAETLVRLTIANEPLFGKLLHSAVNELFYIQFNKRLLTVLSWVNQCENLFAAV